jgi:hypothetical protein
MGAEAGTDGKHACPVMAAPSKQRRHMKNEHNLVILSCKRGEYLTDIMRDANGKEHLFFTDGDQIEKAVEFAACYTAKELLDLAESYGPDFEVQPVPCYTIEVRYESILGEDTDKTWTEDTETTNKCPSQAECDAIAAEHLGKRDGITGVEIVVYSHDEDQSPHEGMRLDCGGAYRQKYQLAEVDDGGRRNLGGFATLSAAAEAAKLATDDGWQEPGNIGSRTPAIAGYRAIQAYREDETTHYVVVMEAE